MCSGSRSRSITYQSRMSYLKSREGDSGGRKLLGKKIIGDTSPNSFPFGASLKPCSAEKLLPPMQLMTRERSFRHLYRKFHPPAQIRKMDFLQRKEDPAVKKKREEIYTRIRAAESASNRRKREKEAWESNRNERLSNNGNEMVTLPNSSSEISSNEDSQDALSVEMNSSRQARERGSFVNGVVSGFVADTKKVDVQSSVASNSIYSGYDDLNDDEVFVGNFSFLADWKKETESGGPMSAKRRRQKHT
jgi:hypothetical protein